MKYQETFKPQIRDIYAAHGKSVPSDAIVLRVWSRVKEFPDAFMGWACAKLQDYEKLPGNLGWELAGNLYSQWRSETGGRRSQLQGCPECDRETPGFFMGWKRYNGGIPYSATIRCLCNSDPAFGNIPAKSRDQAQREGWALRPLGDEGSPAGFEDRHFPGSGGSAKVSRAGMMARSLARNPAGPEPVRKDHARQLELADIPF